MRLSPAFSSLLVLAIAPAGFARDRYVDPIHGDERNDGYSAKSTGDGHGPVKANRVTGLENTPR